MSASARDHFGELRSLIHGRPHEAAWRAMLDLIDSIPASSVDEVFLPYALEHLERWPKSLRQVPIDRVRLLNQGRAAPSLALCQVLLLHRFGPGFGRRLTNRFLETLASSEYALSLVELDLRGASIGDRAARALARSETLEQLERIDLGATCVTALGVRAVASSECFTLRSLGLEGMELGDLGVITMAEALQHDTLRRLVLARCELTDACLPALLEAPGLAALEELDLSYNQLTDEGVRFLARCRALRSLEKLGLDYNDISARGLEVLESSPFIPGTEISCYPAR